MDSSLRPERAGPGRTRGGAAAAAAQGLPLTPAGSGPPRGRPPFMFLPVHLFAFYKLGLFRAVSPATLSPPPEFNELRPRVSVRVEVG